MSPAGDARIFKNTVLKLSTLAIKTKKERLVPNRLVLRKLMNQVAGATSLQDVYDGALTCLHETLHLKRAAVLQSVSLMSAWMVPGCVSTNGFVKSSATVATS